MKSEKLDVTDRDSYRFWIKMHDSRMVLLKQVNKIGSEELFVATSRLVELKERIEYGK